MIIYGRNSSHLKTVQLTNDVCAHCGVQGSIILSTYASYAHVFWVPFFPLGRTSFSECQHCKQVLKENQMPQPVKMHHKQNLAETRIPIWQFVGVGLLMMIIVSAVYGNQRDKQQQAKFLQSPAIGDVYEYKTSPTAYTTFKVEEVIADTLVVKFNNYQVDKVTGLPDIDKSENYADSTYSILKSRVAEMFKAGEIIDINRH